MQNLLHLLQELKVPAAIETKIIIVPRNKEKVQDLSYQLQLDLDNDNEKKH